MSGYYLALFTCWGCRNAFSACPECVTTIHVDPITNRPPDAAMIDGKAQHVAPDPDATRRAVREPVCDSCVERRNAVYITGGPDARHIEGMWETTEARHRRAHA